MATKRWISTSSTSFNTDANWSTGYAPANSDVLVFDGTGTANVSTNLSTALTGITIIIEPANSAKIGTATSPLVLDGGTLKMPSTSGSGNPAGTSLININFGSTAATVTIETSNATGDSNRPTVRLAGSAITARITGGNVGFAVLAGQTATLADIVVARAIGQSPRVLLGDGVTVTAATYETGTIINRSTNTNTTVRVSGATYNVEATCSAAHTTLHLDDGECNYNGSGTITTANIKGRMILDGNPNAVTITTAKVYAGGTLSIDNGKPGGVTITNAVEYPDGLSENAGMIRMPAGMKLTVATI